jgi:hypothetical protein
VSGCGLAGVGQDESWEGQAWFPPLNCRGIF